MERAGVPRINFHALRHTYAFHYVRNGGNIRWLQENLGHQFIETTEQYAHQVGVKRDGEIVNFAKKESDTVGKDGKKALKPAKNQEILGGEEIHMPNSCHPTPKLRLVQ